MCVHGGLVKVSGRHSNLKHWTEQLPLTWTQLPCSMAPSTIMAAAPRHKEVRLRTSGVSIMISATSYDVQKIANLDCDLRQRPPNARPDQVLGY